MKTGESGNRKWHAHTYDLKVVSPIILHIRRNEVFNIPITSSLPGRNRLQLDCQCVLSRVVLVEWQVCAKLVSSSSQFALRRKGKVAESNNKKKGGTKKIELQGMKFSTLLLSSFFFFFKKRLLSSSFFIMRLGYLCLRVSLLTSYNPIKLNGRTPSQHRLLTVVQEGEEGGSGSAGCHYLVVPWTWTLDGEEAQRTALREYRSAISSSLIFVLSWV